MKQILGAAILGLSLIAAAFLAGGRFVTLPPDQLGRVMRLDRFTGEIVSCQLGDGCDYVIPAGYRPPMATAKPISN